MQRYDIGVLEFLEDPHFSLNLFFSYSSSAATTLALLDKLGSIFSSCAFLYTTFHYCKLTTADTIKKAINMLSLTFTNMLFIFLYFVISLLKKESQLVGVKNRRGNG